MTKIIGNEILKSIGRKSFSGTNQELKQTEGGHSLMVIDNAVDDKVMSILENLIDLHRDKLPDTLA